MTDTILFHTHLTIDFEVSPVKAFSVNLDPEQVTWEHPIMINVPSVVTECDIPDIQIDAFMGGFESIVPKRRKSEKVDWKKEGF